MKKYLLPFLFLLFALPAFSQYVHRNTLVGTGWKPVGASISSYQGGGISISADGNVAVVGGEFDSTGRGSAWVYTRNGTIWTQMGNKLVPNGFTINSSAGGVLFGYSSAISANGNTIAIGGYYDNSKKGATWIFERQGNVWVQQGPKLVGTPSFNAAYQGEDLALSADGNTLLIGADEGAGPGSVYVFQRTGTTWTQQGPKLSGTTPNYGWAFGASVALTAGGNTAFIGAPLQQYTPGNQNTKTGYGYFFRRTGTTWNMIQHVTDSLLGDRVGSSATISANGNVAFLGAPLLDNQKGAIWVYKLNPANQKFVKWQILKAIDAVPGSQIGRHISISRGGDTLVTSGETENSEQGAIYVFVNNNGTWSQLGTKQLSPISGGTNPNFGYTISLSGNGKILLAGRPGISPQGAGLVFYTPDILSTKKELEPELKFYPNPVSDFLYLPATASYTRLTVSDLTGKVLLTETKPIQRIDLSTVSAGIYIVSLQQENKIQHVRIVKE